MGCSSKNSQLVGWVEERNPAFAVIAIFTTNSAYELRFSPLALTDPTSVRADRAVDLPRFPAFRSDRPPAGQAAEQTQTRRPRHRRRLRPIRSHAFRDANDGLAVRRAQNAIRQAGKNGHQRPPGLTASEGRVRTAYLTLSASICFRHRPKSRPLISSLQYSA